MDPGGHEAEPGRERDAPPAGVPEEGCAAAPELPQLGGNEPASAPERTGRLLMALQTHVIPELARAHGFVAPLSVPTRLGPAEVEAFTQMILHDGETRLLSHVEALRRDGLPLEALFMDLFAPAARRLGEMWVADGANFADVTVAVGRLQRLLRILSPAFGSEVERPLHSLRVLLVAAPGEQHTFGLSMVGEFFRRAGWDVTGGWGGSGADAVAEARKQWFDAVGFSVGALTRLDWLGLAVADVRRVSRNREVLVMVGGPVFAAHPEYQSQVGADLASTDGREAPRVAQQWLLAKGKRDNVS